MMWRNNGHSYGAVAIVLHWTIAVLFVGQIALGYLTQATSDRPRLQFELYQWHKSFGFLVLALALLRVGWSFAGPKPRPVPNVPPWKEMTSRTVHGLLLVLTILVPLTGWAIASSSPLRIPSFAFNLVVIPDLPLERSDALEALWSQGHALLAYAAGLLALMHAGAALHHHFVLKDGTLTRMLRAER